MTKTATRPETKHLAVPFELKGLNDDERTFEGLLATWDLDLGGDVIHRGAFKKTLGDWKATGRTLPLIDNHNYSSVFSVMGKLLDAKETSDGLWTKWGVVPSASGDELLARLKGGYVDSMSIGYRPVKATPPSEAEERAGISRHLKEIELREGSTVIFPMNTGAAINADSVKALIEGLEQKGELEEGERAELATLRERLDALLDRKAGEQHEGENAAGDAGLAPDHPQRIAAEATLRAIKVRQVRRSSHSAPEPALSGEARKNLTQTGEQR